MVSASVCELLTVVGVPKNKPTQRSHHYRQQTRQKFLMPHKRPVLQKQPDAVCETVDPAGGCPIETKRATFQIKCPRGMVYIETNEISF